jgi:hypothetical protein
VDFFGNHGRLLSAPWCKEVIAAGATSLYRHSISWTGPRFVQVQGERSTPEFPSVNLPNESSWQPPLAGPPFSRLLHGSRERVGGQFRLVTNFKFV